MAGLMSWMQDDEESSEDEIVLNESPTFARGLSGVWNVGTMYKLWAEGEVDLDMLPKPIFVTVIPEKGALIYYQDVSMAIAAKSVLGGPNKDRAPGQVWRAELPLSRVVGWHGDKSAAETFQRDMDSHEASIGSYKINQYGAGLHLCMLPSFVQSVALAIGALKEPVYDYGALTTIMEGIEALDKATASRLSDPKTGELVLARAALWHALGEEDPTRYSKDGKNSAIQNDVLKSIVKPLWKLRSPIPATFGRCPIPTSDAVSKTTGKQNYTGVCTKAWCTEEEMRAELEAEVSHDGPQLPAQWRGNGTTTESWLGFYKKFLVDNVAPPAAKKDVAKVRAWLSSNGAALEAGLGVTIEEASDWLDKVMPL